MLAEIETDDMSSSLKEVYNNNYAYTNKQAMNVAKLDLDSRYIVYRCICIVYTAPNLNLLRADNTGFKCERLATLIIGP